MIKIGVFGGSFNPVHNAHVKTALLVKEKLCLDKMIIIPAGIPPHKLSINMADSNARFEMCKIAFDGLPDISVSSFEIDQKTVSYTYKTLTYLSQENKDAELYFICGADMFLTLDKWKYPEKIFSLAKIVTLPRNDDDFYELDEYSSKLKLMGAQVIILKTEKMKESSTEIRKKLSNGESIADMVPRGVSEYIKKNKLYGDDIVD